MSVEACAGKVESGDPDRFAAVMAAPAAVRERLFALYAFNLEVARAPVVTREPMIAAIRLAWWREALDEIAAGGVLRQHEVVVPLALALPPGRQAELTAVLGALIEARHLDIDREPFAGPEALLDYLDQTSGGLLWAAAAMLGAERGAEAAVRSLGRAQGLANWLMAAPALAAAGWEPLPGGEAAMAALARRVLAELKAARLPRNPALLAGWRARPLLAQAVRAPERIAAGGIGQSEFQRRLGLLIAALRG